MQTVSFLAQRSVTMDGFHGGRWSVVLLAGVLAGCAGGDAISLDTRSDLPYPWCADELRAAAEQPLPDKVTQEQRQAVRDYHVSKACQDAGQHTVTVPLSHPLPRKP